MPKLKIMPFQNTLIIFLTVYTQFYQLLMITMQVSFKYIRYLRKIDWNQGTILKIIYILKH